MQLLKFMMKLFVCLSFFIHGELFSQCDIFTAVSAGGQTTSTSGFSIALKSDGTVWAWGFGNNGQLGNGANNNSNFRVQVQGLTDVIAISAGGSHALALKQDGTVWAWGNNITGQLGTGTQIGSSNVPVQVVNLSNVTQIAAGLDHSLALLADGSVWAWGNGLNGQLGNNTTPSAQFAPSQVINSSLGQAKAIAAGSSFSLAIKASDGTVWAWGFNSSGQLGDNSTIQRLVPVAVNTGTGLTSATAISAGNFHSLAIKSDGTAWAWGLNTSGQVGNGTATNQFTTPQQVGGPFNVANSTLAISGGGSSSYALLNVGTGQAWAWGLNTNGQLGNNSTLNTNVPVAVDSTNLDNSVSAIEGGSAHALALRNDGTVWAWGGNSSGQLDSGITGPNSLVPALVTMSPFVIATPASQSICTGFATNIVLSSNLPNATFSWSVVQNGVTGASAGTGNLIRQTLALLPGNTTGTAVYTVIASVDGCIGTPLNVTVTVNAGPDVIATPPSQEICSGTKTNIVLTSNIPNATFSILSLSNVGGVIGASFNLTDGFSIQQTLSVAGANPGTVTYTVAARNPVTNCTGTPLLVTVIVNPCCTDPIPDVIATPSSQTICSGTRTNIQLTSNVPGTTFAIISFDTAGSVVGASTALTGGNSIQQFLQTDFAGGGEVMYLVEPINPVTQCRGTPIEVFVTVLPCCTEPAPDVIATPAEQTICSGTSTNIQLSSTVPHTTFTIQAISNNVTGASSVLTNGNSIQQFLITGTPFGGAANPGFVTYRITPINAFTGCVGTPINVFVTVLPCGPTPPSNFCGKVKKEKRSCCDTGIVHVLRWEPSTDPTVDHYEIKVFIKGFDIEEKTVIVPATGPFRFSFHNLAKGEIYLYRLIAVAQNGNQSTPLDVILPKKGESHNRGRSSYRHK